MVVSYFVRCAQLKLIRDKKFVVIFERGSVLPTTQKKVELEKSGTNSRISHKTLTKHITSILHPSNGGSARPYRPPNPILVHNMIAETNSFRQNRWSTLYVAYSHSSSSIGMQSCRRHASFQLENSSYWCQNCRQVLHIVELQFILRQIIYIQWLVCYDETVLCIFVEYYGHIYDFVHFVSVLCDVLRLELVPLFSRQQLLMSWPAGVIQLAIFIFCAQPMMCRGGWWSEKGCGDYLSRHTGTHPAHFVTRHLISHRCK